MKIMGPAVFSSGMLQINVYTDLFFASTIPGAGAAFNYANYLVQTPLGIISNIILLPLLPMLSRLAAPSDWVNLKLRIRQGLLLTAITMLPLGALIVALAFPAVRIVYERGAFKHHDSMLVTSVLMAYGIGMFVYLGRDVMVRVFYALGDGNTPFRISMANILLNAVLDYFLVKPFGAPGLILATAGVNLISMVVFLWLLDRKLNGLPWQEWIAPLLGLTGSSVAAGLTSWAVLWVLEQVLGSKGLLVLLLQLCLSGLFGLAVFCLLAMRLNLPEIDLLVSRLRQRFLPKQGA
jgi:putative peptidoglycan lipid II flippase